MGNIQSKIDDQIYIITYNCQIKYFSNYKSNRLLNYILNYKDNNFILCIQGLYDDNTISYIENNITKNINIIKSNYKNGLIILCTYDIIHPEQILFKSDK